MAPPSKLKEEPRSPPPPPSHLFTPTATTVAVTQICQTIGYHAAEPSALRSLSAIASKYLESLGRSAASIANSRGRTDSNILDLILAIEDLAIPRGFASASDPKTPVLRSSVAKELIAFVRSVDEVPFPKPLRRRREKEEVGRRRASFAEVGREPPFSHVPRWLPCFPERWESGGRERKRREREKDLWRWEERLKLGFGDFGRKEEEEKKEKKNLMRKVERAAWEMKGRVRFRLVELGKEEKKKRRLLLLEDEKQAQ